MTYVLLLTEVLEVDPDLVHPPGEGAAEHHAGRTVEAHPLELSVALLARPRPRHPADLTSSSSSSSSSSLSLSLTPIL